jgi:hypothetical protein
MAQHFVVYLGSLTLRSLCIANSVNSAFVTELQFGQSTTVPTDKDAVILFD